MNMKKSSEKQYKTVDSAYTGKGAYEYDSRRFKTDQGKSFHSLELEQLKKAISSINKPAAVCEVGCGTGRFSKYLAEKGYTVTASDPSNDMLKITKEKCADIENVHFKISEGADLQFDDNTFDFVFAIRVMNQTESEEYALRTVGEMIRIAKPGGFILVEFMNENRLFSARSTSHTTTWLTFDEVIETAQNNNCEVIKTAGVLFFPQTILNIMPDFILPLWERIERYSAKVLSKYALRGYVLLRNENQEI